MKRAKVDRFKKSKEDRAKYDKVLSKYIKERKAAHHVDHDVKATAAPAKVEPKKAEAPKKAAEPK